MASMLPACHNPMVASKTITYVPHPPPSGEALQCKNNAQFYRGSKTHPVILQKISQPSLTRPIWQQAEREKVA
jgi:hypothetical protein